LRNLFDRPRVEAAFLRKKVRHCRRWIFRGVAIFDRKFVDLTERFDHVVGPAGLLRFVIAPLADMSGVELCRGKMSSDLANAVENAAPDVLCARMELSEFRRAIVLVAQPAERAGGFRLDLLRG
jgi:hypothetical protein